jgi:hypothetical protein
MIAKNRVRIALVTAAMIAVGSLSCATVAAGKGPDAKPNLRHAVPLHGHNPLLKSSGDPGDDDTAIALTLSALCQSYIGGSNPYNKPAPNVDMINGDNFVLAGSQTGCSTPQNETTIDVNPNNPLNLVGGTNDYRVFNTRENRNDGSGFAYATFDGGASWANVLLPHLTFQTGATGALFDMDSAGDPAVAFGPNNTVYYANLVFSRFNNGSGITVSKSTDGGLTWGEPSIVHTDGVDSAGNPLPTDIANDKEWITVDQTTGTIYVTWTQFGPTGSPIVVSKSTDGGSTWSAPRQVNPAFTPGGITLFSSGSNPKIGRNGELYIAYESAVCQTLNCDQPTDHDAIIMAKSTDGGATFENVEVAADFDFPFNPDTGRDTLTGENFRINSFPQFAIDAVTGRLWVTWADDRNGQYDANGNSIKTNGDVFVVTSSNGKNWNQFYQLGTSADEVYPAIAAYNARVVVTFYTRAYDPNGIGLDYAYVDATGLGNLKHTTVTRITTQTANPQIQFLGIGLVTGEVLQGEFIGDYTAVTMGSDFTFHPSWTDFRGNPGTTLPNQDAYTQAIHLH